MTEIEPFGALDAEKARLLTDRIKDTAAVLWELIVAAYHGRAWEALGYESWDAHCDNEFQTSRLRLPREERAEVVASLRDSGLHQRAIASATGLSQSTVSRELSGDSNESPEAVKPAKPTRPTNEQIAEAIKSDPEAFTTASKAIYEKQEERREEFRKGRIAAGVDPDVFNKPSKPVWKDTSWDILMDGVVEEAGRREQIRALQKWALWGLERTKGLVEEHNHTGVADEIEWLRDIGNNITEVQWSLASFMVEKQE